MGVDYYVYNADVYCELCADALKDMLSNTFPDDYDDSECWPQGPYHDEEADSHQHCGSHDHCLDPTILPSGDKVGKFLENPLTTEGEEYVKEMHREHPTEVTTMWMEFYDLTLKPTHHERTAQLKARLKELTPEDALAIVATLAETVLSYTCEDGNLDSYSDCFDEMLEDLHNHGLDPTRY